MDFEFDQNKSDSNKSKHGIDFVEAQALWKDPNYLELDTQSVSEKRILTIGKINIDALLPEGRRFLYHPKLTR